MSGTRRAEALPGGRTMNELRTLVCNAIKTALAPDTDKRCWLYVRDMTDEWAVYELEGDWEHPGCYKVAYSVDDAGEVTLGEPESVEPRTVYETTQANDRLGARVLEAKGKNAAGGRVFRMQIIEYGVSKNGRRYPEKVMRAAVPLYEGAKVFDHHRTEADLQAGTIQGLSGQIRNVEATAAGLEGDLHLLPSATHVAEALDASLVAQTEGLPPIAGMSHDVAGLFKPVVEGGARLLEATQITSVFSADVVADPAAGGRATRAIAGGIGDPTNPTKEHESMLTAEGLVELLEGANESTRAAALAAIGFTPEMLEALKTGKAPAPKPATETAERPTPAAGEYARESIAGRTLVRAAVADSGLDERLVESIIASLPETFTEAAVVAQIDSVKRVAEGLEKAGLTPSVPDVQVTQEAHDKKVARLDAFFAGNYREGYSSLKAAYIDLSGVDPRRAFDPTGEDFNRKLLVECIGTNGRPFDSGNRATESLDSASFAQLLGDAITRRLVAEYSLAALSAWRKIVSAVVPINDFRTQRVGRVGGYGTLPTVNEGAPYQPLTSPGDEEATYAISKKGGTEDLTLEMIANDDVRLIVRIPKALGRAAAQTLYRFVFDLLATNATCTYDSTALFAAGHANTDAASALSQTTLGVGRRKMREQTAYGDTSEVLGATPKTLIVPPELEEIAFQLCTSAVAISANQDATIPNLHQGVEPLVIDYWSDANDWFLAGDPAMNPTIEVGFYQGREDPELFVQSDPTAGSVFTADKITWKIRHIYSGTVLDHRAFYRGQG